MWDFKIVTRRTLNVKFKNYHNLRLIPRQSEHSPKVAHVVPSDAPRNQIDPFWPKVLPELDDGQVARLAVDGEDNHLRIRLQRPHSGDESMSNLRLMEARSSWCCIAAPAVLEFDPAGTVIRSLGGPGYVPVAEEEDMGFMLIAKGSVWISGNGQAVDKS